MNNKNLWSTANTGVVVMPADASASYGDLLPPTGRIAVARLDGKDLADSDSFFWQISDAFMFPSYFGWNWDALYDCLRDLSWYPADRYLLVVEDAEQALVEDREGRAIFFSVLNQVALRWADSIGESPEEGRRLKIILLCAEGAVESLRAELVKSSS